MKSKTLFVISVIAIVIIATMTNPKQDQHVKEITKSLSNAVSGDNKDLMGLFGELLIGTYAAYDTKYNNYVVFSTATYSLNDSQEVNSIGVFGNTFMLTTTDEITKIIESRTRIKDKKSNKQKVPDEQQKIIDEIIGN